MIIRALEIAGYASEHASAERLMDCFKDYVAEGYFENLDLVDGNVYGDNGELIDDWKMVAKGMIHALRR